MSIINKIWNSKAMEVMSEVNYEVIKGLGAVIKGTAEVIGDVIIGMSERAEEVRSERKSCEEETYEYWSSLSSYEQQEYFAMNYKLQEYGEMYRYDSREQMAKSVAEIARRENRTFCNKYDQY